MVGTIVLARLLTPDDFGLVAMVAALYMLLQNLGVNGFIEAIISAKEINHKQISTLFWVNVGLCIALTLLLMALAPLIARFYKEPRLESITIAIAFSIILAGLSTQHSALLRRNMRFYHTSANHVSAMVISTIVAIALALLGCRYWSLVARDVTFRLAFAAGAWILCQWRPALPALGTGVMPLLKFVMNAYGNFSMNYFSRNLEKVLIGWRYGTQSLGYYGRAYHLFATPANQLSAPLTNVVLAALSRLRSDPERYRRSYLNSISMIAFVGMALSATLTLIGSDLILLLLGSQWNKAGQIFTAFGPCIGLMLIYATHGWLHLSLGRPDRWFRWSIIAFIVTALCFVIGLPFGALGVAIAFTASFYVLIGPGLWYAGRPIHLGLFSIISAIWKYCVSALGAGLLCWFVLYSFGLTSNIFVESNILIRLLISCLLCISIYLLLVVGFYQGTKPIAQFISLLYDMVPDIFSKKEGQEFSSS